MTLLDTANNRKAEAKLNNNLFDTQLQIQFNNLVKAISALLFTTFMSLVDVNQAIIAWCFYAIQLRSNGLSEFNFKLLNT